MGSNFSVNRIKEDVEGKGQLMFKRGSRCWLTSTQASVREGSRSGRKPDPERPETLSRNPASSQRVRHQYFGDRLFNGAMRNKKNRVSVLFENGSPRNGQPTEPLVRLRVLQYMSIIHMKRLLAREVFIMSDRRHVTTEQMSRVRRLMKDYGMRCCPC